METFDVSDRNSWYFGSMSRQEATEVLMNERERGVFLVRDSNSIQGDYVLCVREDTKVSNYIINKILQQDQIVYRIGDQSFENLPKLLTFYTLHYLDTTPLRRPIPRKIEKVLAKFDFDGSDQDDLPFRRGEILTIVRKDEDQWWTAKNSLGQIGQIPVPYVQKYDENSKENTLERPGSGGSGCGTNSRSPRIPGGGGGGGVGIGGAGGVINNASCGSNNGPLPSSATSSHHLGSALKKSDLNRKLPAYARVKQARVPNAYDKTALKLEVDDIIKVTKTNINGQWEGELKGKKGHFPFTHVEFIDNDGEMLLNKMLIAGGGGGGGGGGSCIETNTTIVANTATNLRRGDDSTNPIANQTTTAAIGTGTGSICSGGGGGNAGSGGTITNCNQTIGIKTNANDWGGE